MAEKSYQAGVKEYRDKYWTPDYVPLDTDLLACFKCTGQPDVPREEVAAAVAATVAAATAASRPLLMSCWNQVSSMTVAFGLVCCRRRLWYTRARAHYQLVGL